MAKHLLLILLVGLIHPEPLLAEGSCTLKCVKWFIFNCGRADLSCSGDLNCRNGDCGSLDAVATCRRSLSGNWTYIMDCGRMTPDSPGPQWQVAYRRPESLSHVIFSSGRDPLAFPRSAEAESLAADSDVVIRACPASASVREEENPPALDL